MNAITVEDLKAHLNLTVDDDDALLADKIAAAEVYLEQFTGKAFIDQTFTERFDCFGLRLMLPRSPVQSISSITYLDQARQEQTLAPSAYFAWPLGSINGDKTIIYPAGSWPVTYPIAGSLTVTYSAGYGDDSGDVPAPLREAVRQFAAHLYENREPVNIGNIVNVMPLGVHDLVAPYRDWQF